MAITLVANIGANLGAPGGTTSAINTTGANLLIVGVAWYNPSSPGALTDSKGNTWTPLTAQTGQNPDSQIFYCANPIVGSGHTFTYTGVSIYSPICVSAYSGVATSSPLDVQNGAGFSTSLNSQPGSVTPSANNALLVTFTGANNSVASAVIDSSFTITDQIAGGGGNWFGAMAYQIQTTATARNPSWTFNAVTTGASEIAVFKAPGGGGGGGTANNKWFSISGL